MDISIDTFSDVAVLRFTIPAIETKLRNHDVVSTIRGDNYLDEYDIDTGDLLDIYYKGTHIGYGWIDDISTIYWSGLDDVSIDFIRDIGFRTLGRLKNSVKQMFRFHADELKHDSIPLHIIQFHWINVKQKTEKR